MSESNRLNEFTEWIDLEFMKRERTPCEIIEKGIRHHFAGLSLSNTVILLEKPDAERSRTAIYNWVQKADLQPTGGENPDRVAIDQKSIRVNDEEYWLYTAVDPKMNRILHTWLFPTYTILIGREFLLELLEKRDVSDAMFLIDGSHSLKNICRRHSLGFGYERHVNRNSVERVFSRDKTTNYQFLELFPATLKQIPPTIGFDLLPSHGISLSEHYRWNHA